MLERNERKEKEKKEIRKNSHGHPEVRLMQMVVSFTGTKGKKNQFS